LYQEVVVVGFSVPVEVVAMIAKLVDAMFGCWHSNYSFPITTKPALRRTAAAAMTGTYVVCLDCGTELPYDWSEMHVLGSAPKARGYQEKPAVLTAKQAA
jgi:hypothetical protein